MWPFDQWKKFRRKKSAPVNVHRNETELDREISALYSILMDVMGSDRLVIQAGKMDALRYMRSDDPGERILALRRILDENPTLGPAPQEADIPKELMHLSERLADIMARRNVENRIEKKINEKLEKDHQDYVKDIRLQVLKEEKSEVESPQDAKKREALEALDKVQLTQSVMELLRPKTMD